MRESSSATDARVWDTEGHASTGGGTVRAGRSARSSFASSSQTCCAPPSVAAGGPPSGGCVAKSSAPCESAPHEAGSQGGDRGVPVRTPLTVRCEVMRRTSDCSLSRWPCLLPQHAGCSVGSTASARRRKATEVHAV